MKKTILAIAGNVGSGKTTLALALSDYLRNTVHLDSDYIREEITGSPNGKSKIVFRVMRERIQNALNNNTENIILSSTGMSFQYVNIINEFSKIVQTYRIQLNCDYNTWKLREQIRTDRWDIDDNKNKIKFEMPYRAFEESSKVSINPHLLINTSNLGPQDVFEETIYYLYNNI